jgi:16S rRNA (guanine527-N7)-methyltransferase
VKHLDAGAVDELVRLASQIGISLEVSDAKILVAHLDELLTANERLNLTRITSPEAALRLHTLDSITALPELLNAPEGDLLDVGTGGGMPGLPLMIAGHRSGTLIDSVGKKARAVQDIVTTLSLDSRVEVVGSRAEDLAVQRPGAFAAVVARAVAGLPSLLELASPLLRQSGLLIALKGQPTDAELSSALVVAGRVGMVFVSSRSLELPGGGEHRTILVYGKAGKPSLQLPRRVGLAQSSPLG